jgi:RNA polymerase sigma-70 factor (ECF subfamily)
LRVWAGFFARTVNLLGAESALSDKESAGGGDSLGRLLGVADDQRFFTLYRQEEGRLWRMSLAIMGNEADAADALQEATIRGYRAFHQLQGGDAAFGAWMRRILANTCNQLLRKRSRQIPVEEVQADPDAVVPDVASNMGNETWDAVNTLEEHYRQVVVLRFVNDLSLQDIAAALSIPLGTVKSRLHHALKLLRGRLAINQ